MSNKSSKTSLHIIEKVAPIFNKQGYVGTSMKSITDAVGLTKGAIYGNFENKEELALKAFDYNVRKVIDQVAMLINAQQSPLKKLYAMTDFYRNYRDFTQSSGGCPILNIGVEANNQDERLFERLLTRVHTVIRKLEKSMADIIQAGIDCGEIKADVEPERYGKRLFAMIQGAVFMTFTLDDKSYIMDMMDHIDTMIELELIK